MAFVCPAGETDPMDPKFSKIGEKIRALRLSRSMTQKDLAGGSVTRNMLSLIENGNALPSLPTLVDLADRLGVPVGYFFAVSEEEIAAFTKMSRIGEIRRLFREGEHEMCLRVCREIPCPDDDILLISAECSLALAVNACHRHALVTATTNLAEANEAASRCSCPAESLLATIDFMTQLIRCVTHPILPENVLDASRYSTSRISTEFFAYLRALSFLDTDRVSDASALLRSGLIVTPMYQDVVSAKEMMRQNRHDKAFPLLQKVLADSNPGFFTTFRALDALESCASTLGDFKNAYQYSTQKIKLLEQFAQ